MAQLTLSFLGTFQVSLGDDPITKFRSANVQGLLVYLAMQPGHAFSRDVLATLFWPDEPDRTARTNFRQTLYQLRKLLAKGEAEKQPFLTVSRQTVQFNADSNHQCDITNFLQALKVGDLATAVSCYIGDLLPGFTCDSLEFEDWLRRERERLHGLALDALQQRTEWLLSSGSLTKAKAMAQRQLTLEPWRELAHRQLMQAHALAGDRQTAQAQFETCKEILWEELAAEPEPKTIALAKQIAAGAEIQLRPRPGHNLIAPVTPFFGREADLNAVRAHITDRAFRLVTLVGEGGIGKSRLALEVAWQLREQFADGVWFVPLAGLDAKPAEGSVHNERQSGAKNLEDEIATAVAQALDHPLAGQQAPREQLLAFLQERQLLLVLDNFEQLLAGAELVLDLLQQAPGVSVICTSREPLNFQAEWVLPLERLPLPPRVDPYLLPVAGSQDPTAFPAIQLFVDRAQRANGRFQLTAENQTEIVILCRLLAGLPLALELAAAALRHQTIQQLTTSIQQSIDTLSSQRRDIPPRHRSMRAVFDSSWALLSPTEQAQLAGLAIFLGPFSKQAAAAVTEATLYELQTLQEKSLLQTQGERFVLHALLRQFAAEKLADLPQKEAVTIRHSHYYLQAVADLGGALNGEMPHLAVQRIAGAWENVRGAWETAVSRQDFDHILAALVPLSDFCQVRGFYQEGLRMFRAAADHLQAAERPEALAQLLTQQAAMLVRLSDYPQAIAIIEEALALTSDAWSQSRLRITWGEALWRQGELTVAKRKLDEALAMAQAANLSSLHGIATYHLGVVHDLMGAYKQSLAYLEEALAIWQRLGNLRWQGFSLNSIGSVASRLLLHSRAKAALEKSLTISQANNDRQAQTMTLNNLGILAVEQGDFKSARQFLIQGVNIAKATGNLSDLALLQYNLADNAKQAGWWDEANEVSQKALAKYQQVGDKRGIGMVLKLLGDIAAENGRLESAEEFYQESIIFSVEAGNRFHEDEARQALANLMQQNTKKGHG